MHEFSVMTQIVDAVMKEAERHKAKMIREVILEIGELTFLNNEQMVFAYEILSRNTLLEGSKLTIKKRRAKVSCNNCSYNGLPKQFTAMHAIIPVLRCPKCNSQIRITAGKECLIKEIKMEVLDV